MDIDLLNLVEDIESGKIPTVSTAKKTQAAFLPSNEKSILNTKYSVPWRLVSVEYYCPKCDKLVYSLDHMEMIQKDFFHRNRYESITVLFKTFMEERGDQIRLADRTDTARCAPCVNCVEKGGMTAEQESEFWESVYKELGKDWNDNLHEWKGAK